MISGGRFIRVVKTKIIKLLQNRVGVYYLGKLEVMFIGTVQNIYESPFDHVFVSR